MSYNTVDPSTGALTPIPGTETSLAPYGAGYGTCSTAAATTAKEATLSGYKLRQNGYVTILFSNEVPASATLNINSKGAKPIFYKGAAIDARVIKAGDRATFIYDGTNYNLIGRDSESSEIQALSNEVDGLENDKAEKDDLANIDITGTTNNTGSTITSGTYIYLNGTLVRAKSNIANGATLTLNTNYEVVSAGGLNSLIGVLNGALNGKEDKFYGHSPVTGTTTTVDAKYKVLIICRFFNNANKSAIYVADFSNTPGAIISNFTSSELTVTYTNSGGWKVNNNVGGNISIIGLCVV